MKTKNSQKMSNVKQAIVTAVCIALCTVLPMAFHSIPQAGTIYAPMHIPVLICGMVCSFPYAIVCGALGPIISSLLTGMPPAPVLPAMVVELTAYALICSLMMKFVYTKKAPVDVYLSLVTAMLLGRVIAGIAKALIFARGEITITAWATSYFVTSLPAIIIQIVLIPVIYFALQKANLIPSRYIVDEK